MSSAAPSSGRRRQQRGEERRLAIVQAAIDVIESEGLEGVTHRRVADAAGVPLAATTYYFTSKDDLIQAAMEHLGEREAAQLREIAAAVAAQRGDLPTLEQGVEAFVEWQTSLIKSHRLAQFAEFELHLRVARTRPDAMGLHAWPEAYRDVAHDALAALGVEDPEPEALAVVALVHGLVLHALVAPDPGRFADEHVAPVLRKYLLQLLVPAVEN